MRTTAAALWALLAAILLLGPSPWSQGLPGAEAKPSTAMPVTKEDIDRREEKKAKGQPMTDDVESSLPDWEEGAQISARSAFAIAFHCRSMAFPCIL